ncbi:MAG: hypothetical protein KatS3mg110_4648 [Pirellulaceae bacterium]|nr:MAG: hypothetical protein KatS3mg110_4648 [Pirellulaceae bacterium]
MIASHRYQAEYLLMLLLLGLGYPVTAFSQPVTEPPITALAFLPASQQLLAGSQTGLLRWKWPVERAPKSLPVQLRHIHDIATWPSGRAVVLAGGTPQQEGRLVCLAWPEMMQRWNVRLADDALYSVAVDDQAGLWAAAGLDGNLLVGRLQDGQLLHRLSGHSRAVTDAVFLPGGGQLVSASLDQTVRVWDIASERVLRTLDQHRGGVTAVALRPDCDGLPVICTVGQDRTVRFWQPTIGRLVRFAVLEESYGLDVCWLADGQHVAVGGTDGKLYVIDGQTARVVSCREALNGWIYCVMATPDGRNIIAGGNGGVRVMSVDNISP